MAFDLFEHLGTVDFAVCLGSRALHRGAFATVQQTKLNARLICHPPHNAVHRINLADEVTFAQPSNRRIARHHTYAAPVHRHKSGMSSEARRSVSRFRARMAAADHDHIKMFHVKHSIIYLRKSW